MTIDNHKTLDDRLLVDYQYQSINCHRFHRLVEQVSDFVTAVFLRFESLPVAPLPFLRGLNKASRSSRFLDVETEGTSKSARSTAQLQRYRR